MFEILLYPFALMAAVPGGAFVPCLLLVILVARRWRGMGLARRLFAAGGLALWLAYAGYETWMYYWMKSVIAPIRVDLLFLGPLLLLVTAVVLGVAALPGRAVPDTE